MGASLLRLSLSRYLYLLRGPKYDPTSTSAPRTHALWLATFLSLKWRHKVIAPSACVLIGRRPANTRSTALYPSSTSLFLQWTAHPRRSNRIPAAHELDMFREGAVCDRFLYGIGMRAINLVCIIVDEGSTIGVSWPLLCCYGETGGGGWRVCYRERMMTGEVSFMMGKTFRYIPVTFVVAFGHQRLVPGYRYIERVRVVLCS